MFRYLAGLVLVQLVTVGLFLLNADAEPRDLALRAGVPALSIALLAALWFRTLSRADGERDLARTRLDHERERERLQREAERERADLSLAAERDRAEVALVAERTVRREERKTGRRANVKVALAFSAMTGMGVLFVISNLVTLGVLTLATGGGALGGYLLRWRQTQALHGGPALVGPNVIDEAPGPTVDKPPALPSPPLDDPR